MSFANLLFELDTQLNLATDANLEGPHVAADELLCKMLENVFNNDSLPVEYLSYRSHWEELVGVNDAVWIEEQS